MFRIPQFILRNLLVKNSVIKTAEGVSFIIRNSLFSVTIYSLHVLLDGIDIPDHLVKITPDKEDAFLLSDVSFQNPFVFYIGTNSHFEISNWAFNKDKIKITIEADFRHFGEISIEFKAKVKQGNK